MPIQPICLHPENPHYFLFRGQPAILITSAEHYGAVVNLDFDYQVYLDTLAAYGLNYTRIYAGAYLEPEHYFIQDNTLGPRLGRHCLPWGRSARPGYPLGGNLFDLDAWNPEYFTRLKAFVAAAGERGVVVEVCFFNAMYPDTWAKMPLYHANNIQGVSVCACKDFQTLKDERLVAAQCDYVRKLTVELNEFDNVILEICDEPGIHGTQPEDYTPWLRHLAKVVEDTEKTLPVKHILAQQICGEIGGMGDVSGDANIQLIVSQYVGPTDGKQFGGMQLLDSEYGYNKPIELNETAYYPIWYKGDILGASRVEAWEFLLGGGAGFNQLNGLFSNSSASGAGTENGVLLGQLKTLKEFLYSFEFIHMQRAPELIADSLPDGVFARGIAEPGEQYALYLHHSQNQNLLYIVQPGDYSDTLALNLLAGRYRAEWIEPVSGSRVASEGFDHPGGVYSITTPHYSIDLALRILNASAD
jgi:hypothetical protein